MNVDVRAWDNARRREVSLYALGLAVVLMASSYALDLMLDEAARPWHITFAVALVAVALLLGLLHVLPADAAAAAAAAAAEAGEGAPMEPRTLRLKCGNCATEFDLQDVGTRPLYHACPGCGAEGVLRGDEGEIPPAEEANAEAAPAPAHPLRRLKLRCAGCQTVFTVDDMGERPMRTECPGCGRAGELK